MLVKIMAIYYAGALIVGIYVALMETVEVDFRGAPVRCPRLYAGIVAGVLWPVALFKLVTGL